MAKRKNIAERLAALERQAAEVRVRVIEAGEFRLVDRAGRMRVLLEMTRFGPRLAMMRGDETVALELTLTGDGAGMRFTDEEGMTRVFVGATRGAARIGMADGEGAQRLFLGLTGGGEPALTLYDGSQRQVWTTRTTKARAGQSNRSRRVPARLKKPFSSKGLPPSGRPRA